MSNKYSRAVVVAEPVHDPDATPPIKAVEAAEHEHKWRANGTVEVDKMQRSPCSTLDDLFWTEVLAVSTCDCGRTRKVVLGNKNVRRRGDSLRRGNS